MNVNKLLSTYTVFYFWNIQSRFDFLCVVWCYKKCDCWSIFKWISPEINSWKQCPIIIFNSWIWRCDQIQNCRSCGAAGALQWNNQIFCVFFLITEQTPSDTSVSFLDTPEAGRMKTTVWHLNCPIIYYCYNFMVYIMFTGWPNAPGHHLNRLRCTCICPVVAWCLCPVSDTQTYNYQGLGEGHSHYFQNWTKQRKKEIVSFSKISLWMS